ncbi:MAG: ATP-binding protein [Chloroflexota bacterium]
MSTNYDIEGLQTHLQNNPDVITKMTRIHQSLANMVEDIRRICGNLRPPTIDSLGLVAAIQSYTNQWSEHTGILVHLDIQDTKRLPEDLELSLFRIIQESLSNINRHADATEVEIVLNHSSPRHITMLITDNGIGLDDTFNLSTISAQGNYGLLGISERVSLLHGNLRFLNQPNSGLRIEIEIPHPRLDYYEVK